MRHGVGEAEADNGREKHRHCQVKRPGDHQTWWLRLLSRAHDLALACASGSDLKYRNVCYVTGLPVSKQMSGRRF
jgi:hypothetical protein